MHNYTFIFHTSGERRRLVLTRDLSFKEGTGRAGPALITTDNNGKKGKRKIVGKTSAPIGAWK